MITPDRAGVRVFMVVFTLTVQAVLHAAASQGALAILPMAVLFLSARSPHPPVSAAARTPGPS